MIIMNPLVQVAILVFLTGLVALLALLFTDYRKGLERWAGKWTWVFGDDDEEECPEWADPVKWRQSR